MESQKSLEKEENNENRQILYWIKKALKTENVKIKILTNDNGTDQSEGYVGKLVFVEAYVNDADRKETLSLVIKSAKKEKINDYLVKCWFTREIEVYSKIFSAFKKIETDMSIKSSPIVPSYYWSQLDKNERVLILQNMKVLGYGLFDRYIPMDVPHIKACLKCLGKYHALSFAWKAKYPNEFEETKEQWKKACPMDATLKSFLGRWVDRSLEYLYEILQDNHNIGLLQKLRTKLKDKQATTLMLELLNEEKNQVVVTHGDSWINNFLFKYKNKKNQKEPENAVVIDFQISAMGSPITDISFLLYAVCSKNELQHAKDLLQYYYQNISNFMQELGLNPEQMFPYEDFKNHWKKYSAYGFLFDTNAIAMNFDKGTVVFADEESYEKLLSELKDNKVYLDRLIEVTQHFIEFEF